MQLDVGLIRQILDKIPTRVEQQVSHTENTMAEHAASLQTLRSKVRALEYKMDNAENRNCMKFPSPGCTVLATKCCREGSQDSTCS